MQIECVPNISEGRDSKKVDRIVSAAARVPSIRILHIDSGYDANRSVITMVGTPESIIEAAFSLIREAAREIDMRAQHGAHPRIGAADVVPFVPLGKTEMTLCIEIAKNLGERVGAELGIPVYLYEEAAKSVERRNLADIRRGEFEGLREKLKHPDWSPDFGPDVPHELAGAVVIGARKFLIAFNVNLNTTNVDVAREIAARVRTAGYRRGKERIPGKLSACKAIGWFMPEFQCAQVSMNLFDYESTGLFEAYEACAEEAKKFGVVVTGSELVGLVPKAALLTRSRTPTVAATEPAERTALRAAVVELGLEQFGSFRLEERVIELALGDGQIL